MTKEIILSKGDFVLLSSFIKNHSNSFSEYSLRKLAQELQNATVVENEHLPADVVRLNSEVKIREEGVDRLLTFQLVMPSQADVNANRISIFAPLSAALIGYRKGDVIEWEVPVGIKRYSIVDVRN